MNRLATTVMVAWVLVLVSACGRDETQIGDDPTIGSFQEFRVATPTNLVGRAFDVNDVRATRVVGDYLFWGGDGRTELPIVLEGEWNGSSSESSVQVRVGRSYRIVGSVRLVENVPDDSRMWRLMSPAQVAEVRRVGIFLDADTVREQ